MGRRLPPLGRSGGSSGSRSPLVPLTQTADPAVNWVMLLKEAPGITLAKTAACGGVVTINYRLLALLLTSS